MITPQDRFWAKVDKSGGCWLWTAFVHPNGYGIFKVGRKAVGAHRVAYELLVGPIPEGYEIDHRTSCPRNCVNPAHLRSVTQAQNKQNRPRTQKNSQSGVRGVYWRKDRGFWYGTVQHGGKTHYAGSFSTKQAAEEAVIALRSKILPFSDYN